MNMIHLICVSSEGPSETVWIAQTYLNLLCLQIYGESSLTNISLADCLCLLNTGGQVSWLCFSEIHFK